VQKGPIYRALFALGGIRVAPQLCTDFLKFSDFFEPARTASFRTFAVASYPLRSQKVPGAARIH